MWEVAAIGMAAGAGLWVLATVVTVLHFVVAYGFTWLVRRLPGRRGTGVELEVRYPDGHGTLRSILEVVTGGGWSVDRAVTTRADDGTVNLTLQIFGPGPVDAVVTRLAATPDVLGVDRGDADDA